MGFLLERVERNCAHSSHGGLRRILVDVTFEQVLHPKVKENEKKWRTLNYGDVN
jgi:hypothetical protein